MDITITLIQENVDALCKNYGYQDQLLDENGKMIANPVTDLTFAGQKIADWVNQLTKDNIINMAVADAKDSAGKVIASLPDPIIK